MPVQKVYPNQNYVQNAQVSPKTNVNYGMPNTPGIINPNIINSNITGNIGG